MYGCAMLEESLTFTTCSRCTLTLLARLPAVVIQNTRVILMMVTEYGHCSLLHNYPVYLGLLYFNSIFEANPQKWLKRGINHV